jgi:hypothetical protein
MSIFPCNIKVQQGIQFPCINIFAIVISQYSLMTEKTGLNHLGSVSDTSIRGIERVQRPVSNPDIMDMIISVSFRRGYWQLTVKVF